jgi:hypothetical protein
LRSEEGPEGAGLNVALKACNQEADGERCTFIPVQRDFETLIAAVGTMADGT